MSKEELVKELVEKYGHKFPMDWNEVSDVIIEDRRRIKESLTLNREGLSKLLWMIKFQDLEWNQTAWENENIIIKKLFYKTADIINSELPQIIEGNYLIHNMDNITTKNPMKEGLIEGGKDT